jgi:hypothetical protein
MTLATRHNEKKLVEKELYHKLNTHITIFIILIGSLGVATATLISIVYGSATFMTPFSSSPSSENKFAVTHPNGAIQTIYNYAVWPSSSSSYVFVAE